MVTYIKAVISYTWISHTCYTCLKFVSGRRGIRCLKGCFGFMNRIYEREYLFPRLRFGRFDLYFGTCLSAQLRSLLTEIQVTWTNSRFRFIFRPFLIVINVTMYHKPVESIERLSMTPSRFECHGVQSLPYSSRIKLIHMSIIVTE